VGMARFMAERAQLTPGGQRYDREGLFRWAKQRFPGVTDSWSPEEFLTFSRSRIQELVLEASRKFYPARDAERRTGNGDGQPTPHSGQEDIDAKLEDAFRGTSLSEPDDARELVEWARTGLGVEVPEADLTGVSQDKARQVLWNAFDEKY